MQQRKPVQAATGGIHGGSLLVPGMLHPREKPASFRKAP